MRSAARKGPQLQRARKHPRRPRDRQYEGHPFGIWPIWSTLPVKSGGLALPRRSGLSSHAQLSAIELLASFIVDSAGGAIICGRWPLDGGEALVIFSDKKLRAGPEYALPLLDLSEETVRNELELNQVGKQNLFG